MGGAATGITPQESLPSVPSLTSTLFQSNIDGIRIGVPNGWDLEDLNNTDPTLQQTEQSYSAGVLVELCPQTKQPLSYFPTERLEPCAGMGAEYGER